ncbi:MAG TPA: right-handed parallel beta-helix repeat-containing protein [Thermoanaerobaculia bacterium]|nr:right-handed parallel beta-helix repeat-containing protein [Thermoanaerobaculia bacterium]
MRFTLRLAIAAVLILPSAVFAAPQLVRVPQDAKDIQIAINTVADGGVIELAANTYATPPKGFVISNERKGFTVRAAGTVALDGGGANLLLRYENGQRGRGKLVIFEGITFRNGASLTEGYAGGVTLSAAEARFVGCVFENNTATGRTSGGGAVRVLEGSEATFAGTAFRNNSSLNRGGAIEAIVSTVTIQGGELTGNRVNLPGHKASSAGGGIYLLDSTLRVSGARFQGNQAGWVGGAIYGFGLWADPVTTPKTLVQVSRSTFSSNSAGGTIPSPTPTTGGAIHVEDQSTLEVDSSVFTANVAEFGGAIDNHRAVTDVRGSWFQGNRAPLTGTAIGAGGAIFVSSQDFADSSTGFGAINRRSARLILSDTLFRGGGTVAHTGGCVMVGGDESRAFGENGVPAAGTVEENRARVEMRRTVFSDCDVATAPLGGAGSGGAIQAVLVDLIMEDSLVMDSHAQIAGGGLALERDSVGVISGTTFANNSTAGVGGGALFLHGSTAQVAGSTFIGNQSSQGSAIYTNPLTHPGFPRNVGGLVSGSFFSGNGGIAVWDSEPGAGLVNGVRYHGNHFFPGDRVYGGNVVGFGGISVAQLNGLPHKSDGTNVRLTSAPRLGTVLAVPPFLGAGAPGGGGKSFLAYAWSGGSATLAGRNLTAKAGLLEATAAGDQALSVNGGPVDSARIAASSCTSGPSLCLNGDRFVAEVSWKDFQGNTGTGKAVSLTNDTGYFWFFDQANAELVVKVLDGRGVNGSFWVFYGSLSSVQYTLKITDTATGRVRTYTNPAGKMASTADTGAFAASTVAPVVAFEEVVEPLELETAEAATCVPGPTDLCLNGRFRVSLSWKTQGSQGAGQAVPLTSDTGYFWFFQSSNVEVVVKVLDGRPLNGHFWVFYGALTDVEYKITVVDTQTGKQVVYTNPSGRMGSVGDTSALKD